MTVVRSEDHRTARISREHFQRSIRGNQDNLFHISTLKTLSRWFNFCFGGKRQLKESRFQKKRLII